MCEVGVLEVQSAPNKTKVRLNVGILTYSRISIREKSLN